ncbi:MAG: alpha/beta fold hydrolase [Candidatus Colwellbacteria bacterium]|nr:alpha/beta fold hydrolase [Candidatus Colwellbacteria bacterium]
MEFIQTQKFNNHNIATVFHDAGSKNLVIFCHGYRGSSIGPNRFFVRLARDLADKGISSLRFDQYGCGNSEGDFKDSSFNDWLETTRSIIRHYQERDFRIALLGQSMGGAAVIAVGSELDLVAVVAWAPDPNIEEFIAPESGIIEEGGQIVQVKYWQEAHDARVADRFPKIKAPTYIIFASEDEMVSRDNQEAIISRAQPHQKVEVLEGHKHSAWTYNQATNVINKTAEFIIGAFSV